jgi:hypothetical protein
MARAVWARHIVIEDAQENPRMTERTVTAVTGHGALVHVDGLGWGGSLNVWHERSLTL